ncbi:MAG: helix-turn-helix domain-containing protein [Sphingobacteriia bacterium]|nr:helix-turn-helix domain-containing protein [Sphingobacteriia bacterium]
MKQPELGKKIIELRKSKGLTQEELVEKCNLNVRTLQRIEAGEVNPRNYTKKSIFVALDYDENAASINKENTLKKIYNQLQKFNMMNNSKFFFHNFFLSIGIVWFLSALAIVIFELNFQKKEILLTLIFPFAYALIRQFEKSKSSKAVQD